MGLSDIKGERVLEVIADLVEPLANIAGDERVFALFDQSGDDLPTKAKKALPVLLKEHKDDLIAVLSTVKGVSAKEYAESMTFSSVLGDVYAIITDEELLSFLSSPKTTA